MISTENSVWDLVHKGSSDATELLLCSTNAHMSLNMNHKYEQLSSAKIISQSHIIMYTRNVFPQFISSKLMLQ